MCIKSRSSYLLTMTYGLFLGVRDLESKWEARLTGAAHLTCAPTISLAGDGANSGIGNIREDEQTRAMGHLGATQPVRTMRIVQFWTSWGTKTRQMPASWKTRLENARRWTKKLQESTSCGDQCMRWKFHPVVHRRLSCGVCGCLWLSVAGSQSLMWRKHHGGGGAIQGHFSSSTNRRCIAIRGC